MLGAWQPLRGQDVCKICPHSSSPHDPTSCYCAIGPSTLGFLKERGRRVSLKPGDPRSTLHLLKQLSSAVQEGGSCFGEYQEIMGDWCVVYFASFVLA